MTVAVPAPRAGVAHCGVCPANKLLWWSIAPTTNGVWSALVPALRLKGEIPEGLTFTAARRALQALGYRTTLAAFDVRPIDPPKEPT